MNQYATTFSAVCDTPAGDCKWYRDSRVKSKPMLYLPTDFTADANFEVFEKRFRSMSCVSPWFTPTRFASLASKTIRSSARD
jgi:hypothetical protein